MPISYQALCSLSFGSLSVQNLFSVTKKKKKKKTKTQIINKFLVSAKLPYKLKDLQFIFQKNIGIILTVLGFSWSSSDNIQQNFARVSLRVT